MPLFFPNNKVFINNTDNSEGYLIDKISPGTNVNIASQSFAQPVAQYLFNEATSGQVPTHALDNTASPINLTINYSGADPSYTTSSTGSGLMWAGGTAANLTSASLTGTKIDTNISNSKSCTLEVVSTINTLTTFSNIFTVGNIYFAAYNGSGTNLNFGLTGNGFGAGFNYNERAVFHFVFDTTKNKGGSNNIIMLYINGCYFNSTFFGWDPAQNVSFNTLGLGFSGTNISVGDSLAGNSIISYAAIYSTALSSLQIKLQAAALLLNDDISPVPSGEYLKIDNNIAISAGAYYCYGNRFYFANDSSMSFGASRGTITAGLGGVANINDGAHTISSGTVSFSNSNVTFGMSGSTIITASFAGGTGTGNLGGIEDGFGSILTNGTIVLSNSNNFTFGMSGSTRITCSYAQNTVPSAYAVPGTTITSGTIFLSNANNMSFGVNGNTITASAAVGINAISAGTTQLTNGTLILSNSGNITWGVNGNTVTASMVTSPVPPIAALSAGTTRATSGSVVFSNSNGLGFGINGNTITASYGPTMSMFEYPPGQFYTASAGVYSDAIQEFIPFPVLGYMSATQAGMMFSVNVQTTGAGTTLQGTLNMALGLYTMNASTLSLATSGSQIYTWFAPSTASNNGPRVMTVPMNINATPGHYWMGYWFSSISNSGSIGLTYLGGEAQTMFGGSWGMSSNSSYRVIDGLGQYTAAQSTLLSSAALTDIDHSDFIRVPYFVLMATS